MRDDLDRYLDEVMQRPVFAAFYARAGMRFRDQVAWDVCRWALRHVASEDYRQLICRALRHGFPAAVKDARIHESKGS